MTRGWLRSPAPDTVRACRPESAEANYTVKAFVDEANEKGKAVWPHFGRLYAKRGKCSRFDMTRILETTSPTRIRSPEELQVESYANVPSKP